MPNVLEREPERGLIELVEWRSEMLRELAERLGPTDDYFWLLIQCADMIDVMANTRRKYESMESASKRDRKHGGFDVND